jgi:hypothetical protein
MTEFLLVKINRTQETLPADKWEKMGDVLLAPTHSFFGRTVTVDKDLSYHLEKNTASTIKKWAIVIFGVLFFPLSLAALYLGCKFKFKSKSYRKICDDVYDNSVILSRQKFIQANDKKCRLSIAIGEREVEGEEPDNLKPIRDQLADQKKIVESAIKEVMSDQSYELFRESFE